MILSLNVDVALNEFKNGLMNTNCAQIFISILIAVAMSSISGCSSGASSGAGFSLNASPNSLYVEQGDYAETIISISGSDSPISNEVILSISGCPANVECRFDRGVIGYSETTILTIYAKSSALTGTNIIRVYGTKLGESTPILNADVSLTVKPSTIPIDFTRSTYPVGVNPRSIAVADFNKDSVDDLIVANQGSGTVSVLFGNGAGAFPNKVEFQTNARPVSIAVGDVNLDGATDIVVAEQETHSIRILLGDGAGGILSSNDYQVVSSSYYPQAVVIGNFNSDAYPDIAVLSSNSGSLVSVLLGNSAGGFGPVTDYTAIYAPEPNSFSVGDINGDGYSDLAMADMLGYTGISALYGDGAGSFSAYKQIATTFRPTTLFVGDINQDAYSDMITDDSGTGSLKIMLGDGVGGFQLKINPEVLLVYKDATLSDMNGDGKLDIVGVNNTINSVSIILCDGAGGFVSHKIFGVGTNPYSLAVGDFNNDGKPDIATANYDSDSVTVLLHM